MKISFTLLLCLFMIPAKSQITITSNDIPVPIVPFSNMEYSPVRPPAPAIGANQTWDYSTYSGASVTLNSFTTESDTFFTNAGVDISRSEFKDLSSSGAYNILCKYDHNTNGVIETGAYIPYQAYSLAAVSGNANDSLIFQPQKYFYTTPKPLMQFPMTANSSWHSVSERSTDFEITATLLGLNHAPSQHRYRVHRNDSIVGWGVATVYTPNGASIAYDVLLDQYEEYALDSFYVNGTPASPILCNAFSVTQGQKSNAMYGYNFYRAGSLNYLVRFDYGTDSAFSFILGVFQNIDNITTTVNDLPGENYSSVVFPNPSNGNELMIRFENSKFIPDEYIITDVIGKVVESGKVDDLYSGLIKIHLNDLTGGNYFVKLYSGNKELIAQKFAVSIK